MALRNRSLFLYGYEVTEYNRSIDFKTAADGAERQATLRLGFYSLSSLMLEIKRAMDAADGTFLFDVTADRTFNGGLENRVTISTDAPYLELRFGSGTRAGSSAAGLIGFQQSDYKFQTSYTGYKSSGTVFVPPRVGHEYQPPETFVSNYGSVNVSASGVKEAIVFQRMRFLTVRFKYIPEAQAKNEWSKLLGWLISQRLVEFCPDITQPSVVFEGSLESTAEDSKGLGFKLSEMLPSFPGLYDTGLLKFRVNG